MVRQLGQCWRGSRRGPGLAGDAVARLLGTRSKQSGVTQWAARDPLRTAPTLERIRPSGDRCAQLLCLLRLIRPLPPVFQTTSTSTPTFPSATGVLGYLLSVLGGSSSDSYLAFIRATLARPPCCVEAPAMPAPIDESLCPTKFRPDRQALSKQTEILNTIRYKWPAGSST